MIIDGDHKGKEGLVFGYMLSLEILKLLSIWFSFSLVICCLNQRLKQVFPQGIRDDPILFEDIDAAMSIDYWFSLRRDQR